MENEKVYLVTIDVTVWDSEGSDDGEEYCFEKTEIIGAFGSYDRALEFASNSENIEARSEEDLSNGYRGPSIIEMNIE